MVRRITLSSLEFLTSPLVKRISAKQPQPTTSTRSNAHGSQCPHPTDCDKITVSFFLSRTFFLSFIPAQDYQNDDTFFAQNCQAPRAEDSITPKPARRPRRACAFRHRGCSHPSAEDYYEPRQSSPGIRIPGRSRPAKRA